MPTTITMPRLGESVSEGTVGRWLKQVGDTIKKDEPLLEIMTDKVTAEFPSPVAGRVVGILVAEEVTVPVGTPIAEIEEAGGGGSTASATGATSGSSATGTAPSSATSGTGSPTTAPSSSSSSASVPSSNGGTPPSRAFNGGMGTSTGAQQATSTVARSERAGAAERVSPLARRLAQEHGIDLQQVQGTGENGRIRKEDIQAYLDQRTHAQPAPRTLVATAPIIPPMSLPTSGIPHATSAPPVSYSEQDQLVTPSPARRAIAEHMVRSLATSPHAWTSVEVDMTTIARWLDAHKDTFRQREGYGISYQTFVIKATADALREHPYLNASWTDDGKIVLRKAINIGISIALEKNLVVPVIRNADMLNLAGIARTVSDLVTRARSNRLSPDDLQGSTFTVNNPGVFGTVLSMAIINQPNDAILTMDAVVKRPVVVEGDAIALHSMMFVSLSFDHRVLDGLQAARFLAAVKQRLESWNPNASV